MNQMKNWIEAVGKVLQKWFAAERKVTKTVEPDVCKKTKTSIVGENGIVENNGNHAGNGSFSGREI